MKTISILVERSSGEKFCLETELKWNLKTETKSTRRDMIYVSLSKKDSVQNRNISFENTDWQCKDFLETEDFEDGNSTWDHVCVFKARSPSLWTDLTPDIVRWNGLSRPTKCRETWSSQSKHGPKGIKVYPINYLMC